MKLPGWVPRLNRGQKIIRNVLLTVMMLAALWAVKGFPAPTTQLAASWAAAAYGLPEPEVLCEGPWGEPMPHYWKDVILSWEDGRLASALCGRDRLFFQRIYNEFYFAEPEDGTALLYTAQWVNPPYTNPTLYIWSDLPEAVRAEMALRLRGVFHVGYSDENRGIFDEETYDDWDETYMLSAEGNTHGIFPFTVIPKYTEMPENSDRPAEVYLLAMAEEESLHGLTYLRNGNGDKDFAADVSVIFYDQEGNMLRTWEKTLKRPPA